MLKRTITSIIAFAVFVLIAAFSDSWLLHIAICLCSVLGVYEILRCAGIDKKYLISLPAYLIAALLPFFSGDSLLPALYFLLLFLFYLLFVGVFKSGGYSLVDIFSAFSLVFYVVVPLLSIIAIRNMPNGVYWFYMIFLGAWVSDTAAYFCGVLFGKHKLIPSVSPKKTVEGSVGGLLFTAAAFAAYAVLLKNVFDLPANPFLFAAAGLLLSAVSQLGDLSASLIKRHYGKKDYGYLLPGHGGILDRFDSILAVSAFLYVLLKLELFLPL